MHTKVFTNRPPVSVSDENWANKFGHVTFDTRDLCVRTAMGQWRDEIPGPPYGDRYMSESRQN